MSDEYKMSEPNTNHNTVFNKLAVLEQKVEKLKALILLVDPSVSSEEVGQLPIKQWNEFIKQFPDEALK